MRLISIDTSHRQMFILWSIDVVQIVLALRSAMPVADAVCALAMKYVARIVIVGTDPLTLTSASVNVIALSSPQVHSRTVLLLSSWASIELTPL